MAIKVKTLRGISRSLSSGIGDGRGVHFEEK
jgi:hypothetical protein